MKRYLIASLFAIAACTDSGTPGIDPPAPEGGQQLATDPYTLQPGEEVYMCYTYYSPDDKVAITKVDGLSMPGVHHLAFFQVSGEKEEDGAHVCNTIIKTSWIPIWASGTGSKSLTLPEGTGFTIEPHTQYLVQLHLQNSGDKPMDIRVGINLAYRHDPDAVTRAGIYAFGSFTVDIPPQTNDYQIPIHCAPNKEMNIFAVFPHMHKIGTQINVTKNGGDFYKIDPWVFGNQPMDPMNQHIVPGDEFDLACHYDNHTDQPVTFGESSDNEMCFFVMFYYPFTALDGCIAN